MPYIFTSGIAWLNYWIQYNFNDSNTHDSFTTAVSNSFLSPLPKISYLQILGSFRVIFVFKMKMVYCVYSLESPR